MFGCGHGLLGGAVRPGDKSVNDVRGGEGGPACGQPPGYGAPLIVDWVPEKRGDLEVAMKQGLAVMAHDCKGTKLLPACKVRGSYGFMGISLKKETIELKTSDELSANLPFGAAKLSASLSASSAIAIDLRMIGVNATTRARLLRSELEGDCTGATHFVQTATLGAFSVGQQAEGSVSGGVSTALAEASGASSSKKSRLSGDGELDACEKWNPDAGSPPSACKALLRLQLLPIATEDVLLPDDKAGSFRGAVCPGGYEFREGKCTPSTGKGKQCDPTNAQDCEHQCKQGHVKSCTALGRIHLNGIGKAKKDVVKAVEVLQIACEGGESDPKACMLLAHTYAYGHNALPRDMVKSAGLVRRASWRFQRDCGDGDGEACTLAGQLARDARFGHDLESAKALFEQACSAGNAEGCDHVASVMMESLGPRSLSAETLQDLRNRQLPYLTRACNGGHGPACYELASAKDPEALRTSTVSDPEQIACLQRACDSDFTLACAALASSLASSAPEVGRRAYERWKSVSEKRCNAGEEADCAQLGNTLAEGRPGIPKDAAASASAFARLNKISEEQCANDDAEACETMQRRYRFGFMGVAKDDARAREYAQRFRKASERFCSDENTSGCMQMERAFLATLDKDSFLVRDYLRRACNAQRPDPLACRELGSLYAEGKAPAFEGDSLSVELWWKRGCDLGDIASCTALAKAYETGKPLARDEKLAEQYHEHACRSSTSFSPDACAGYDRKMEKRTGSGEEAARYFRHLQTRCEQGKDAGKLVGCIRLASLYERGVGTKADKAKAQEILNERVCNSPESCERASGLLWLGMHVTQNRSQALDFLKQACQVLPKNDGTASSCSALGRRLSEKGALQDLPGAVAAYQRACELTPGPACDSARKLSSQSPPANPNKGSTQTSSLVNPYKK